MKILMVCTNPIFKRGTGGTKRVLDGWVELCSAHNDVVFLTALSPKDKVLLPSNGEDVGNTYYFRQGMFQEEYLHIFTDFNICFLAKLSKVAKKEEVDLIWVTMPYGIISTSITCHGIPIVYDSHGVTSDTVGITLATLKKLSRVFRTPVIKEMSRLLLQGYISLVERLACRRAAHIKTIGEPDRQRFIEGYGLREDKITTISPFIGSREFGKELLRKRRLGKTGKLMVVFHGSYNHSPNYDAFELISNYIAPQVGKRNSNIQFLLAGPDVPLFEKGNVKSLGFVEDIQGLLASSDIAIVPLLEGEGVKTKVFDYMVAGLPIISTKKGIQSIEAVDGKHAIILDGVDRKFINAILHLADDGDRREALGKSIWQLARAKYTRETTQPRMDEMLGRALKAHERLKGKDDNRGTQRNTGVT